MIESEGMVESVGMVESGRELRGVEHEVGNLSLQPPSQSDAN
jgi:hypothetical protein